MIPYPHIRLIETLALRADTRVTIADRFAIADSCIRQDVLVGFVDFHIIGNHAITSYDRLIVNHIHTRSSDALAFISVTDIKRKSRVIHRTAKDSIESKTIIGYRLQVERTHRIFNTGTRHGSRQFDEKVTTFVRIIKNRRLAIALNRRK